MIVFHTNLQSFLCVFLLFFAVPSDVQGQSRAVQLLYRRVPWRGYGSPTAGLLGAISTEKGDLSYRSSRTPQLQPEHLVYPVIPVDVRTSRDASYWNNYNSKCDISCDDGTCITADMKCNGFANCWDGSDEKNCTCSQRISEAKLCDGYKDCPDGSDEVDCVYGCTAEQFTCDTHNSGSRVKCIPMKKRCDGYEDCPLGNDEHECFRMVDLYDQYEKGVKSKGILQKRVGDGDWHTVCKTYSSEQYVTGFAEKACQQIVGEFDSPVFVQSKSLGMIKRQMLKEHVDHLKYLKLADTEANFAVLGYCELVYEVTCPPPKCGGSGNKATGYRRRRRGADPEEFAEVMEDMAELMNLDDGQEAETEDDDTGMIVGGYATKEMEWPYLVGIFRDGEFYCGGSIINEYWVMTAAHCCHNYEKHTFEVQAGMTRRLSWSPYEQTRQVEEIHVHEGYSSKVFSNDIALYKLDRPLYLSKYVTPACLPKGKEDDPSGGDECMVAGWGDLSESGNGPDHMQQVKLPVLAKCKESFTRDQYQICAGYMPGGKDACQGDSGGPFMCTDSSKKPIVNGVVSFGRGCARANEAGAYTRVSAYLDWINKITSGNSYNATLPRPKSCTETCNKPGGMCLYPHERCSGTVECLNGEDESGCSHLVTRAHEGYPTQPAPPTSFLPPIWNSFPQKPLVHFPLQTQPPNYNVASRSRDNYAQPQFYPFLPFLPPPHPFPPMYPSPSLINVNPRVSIRSSRTILGNCNLATEFECSSAKSNGMQMSECIPKSSLCDRVAHCSDGSDEMNCVALTSNFKDRQMPSSSIGEIKGYVLTKFQGEDFFPLVSKSWTLSMGQEACNTMMNTKTAQVQSVETISFKELSTQVQRTQGPNLLENTVIQIAENPNAINNGVNQPTTIQRDTGSVHMLGVTGSLQKINIKNTHSINSNDDSQLLVGFVRCKH